MNEIRFDDIPRLVLSKQACAEIVGMLRRENEMGARRPWGSIEPFIAALIYAADMATAEGGCWKELLWELYDYLRAVFGKYGNYYHRDTQQIARMTLAYVRYVLSHDRGVAQKIVEEKPVSPLAAVTRALLLTKLGENVCTDLQAAITAWREERRQIDEAIKRAIEDPEISELYGLYMERWSPPQTHSGLEALARQAEELASKCHKQDEDN